MRNLEGYLVPLKAAGIEYEIFELINDTKVVEWWDGDHTFIQAIFDKQGWFIEEDVINDWKLEW